MAFIAQYPGSCGECWMQVKDTLCEYNDEDEVVHVRCPALKICPDCHLQKPCECD